MSTKLQTAILGATGYSGFELARLLERHPRLHKPLLLARERQEEGPKDLADVFPALTGHSQYPLAPFSWSSLESAGLGLLFLATPHHVSRQLAPEAVLRGIRVIDLSGAWRLKQPEHEAVYGFHDADPAVAKEFSAKAVYGLPELAAKQIAQACLVANPGCYATSAILASAPLLHAGLVDREHGVVVDSKSGVSGAGKEPSPRTHFVSVADNLSAYAVFNHRHLGEILEQLQLKSSQLIFTPHLLPIPRGILSTTYVRLNRQCTAREIENCLRSFYSSARWVRVFPASQLPQIQYSLHTNYCDIGFCLADDGRRLILVSCLDNLLKGAAGQAVQNMNVMFGWNEDEGLA